VIGRAREISRNRRREKPSAFDILIRAIIAVTVKSVSLRKKKAKESYAGGSRFNFSPRRSDREENQSVVRESIRCAGISAKLSPLQVTLVS